MKKNDGGIKKLKKAKMMGECKNKERKKNVGRENVKEGYRF